MIIATAGHVDHGKTELAKALTGIETDRLAEEKRRGLTIELGFAYPERASGASLGFVDVPGHERFIHTMLVGVAAIDFALIVVAADDGVMPQTREHLAILDILNVKHGAVALNKIDAVDAARVNVVDSQIKSLLAATALKNSSIFPVSARTGEGVTALGTHIEAAASDHVQKTSAGNFRLAVDRSFTMPGAGLVVTGAVFSGEALIDEQLVASPQGVNVRLRSIQSRNCETDVARQGERCALNIAGPDVKDLNLKRGDWIVAQAAHAPTTRFDAKLRVLKTEDKPLKHWAQVHVHAGARHDMARVAILGGKKIEPGEASYVQFVLEAPINVWARDRLVVRDPSAQRTLGGGHVVDGFPPQRGRARPERLARLAAMDQAAPEDALSSLLDLSPQGVPIDAFSSAWNLTASKQEHLLALTPHVVFTGATERRLVTRQVWEGASGEILDAVQTWHRRQPESVGPDLVSLRNSSPSRTAPELFAAVIENLIRSGTLVRDSARVRMPDHRPQLTSGEEALWRDIKPLLDAGGLKPPVVSGIAETLALDVKQVEEFLRRASDLGLTVQVAKNRFYLPQKISALASMAEDLCRDERDQSFDAAAFRDSAGIGRNLTIDVLEYFDRVHFTKRFGNVRQLRTSAMEIFGSGAD